MNPQSDIPSMQEKKNQEREKKRQAERGKEGKKKRSILWSIFTVVTIAIAGAIGRSCANAMFHTSSPYVSTPHTSSPSTTSIDYMEQAMNSLKSGRIQTDLANRSDQLNTEFTILEGKIGAAFTEYRTDEIGNYVITVSLTNKTASETMTVQYQTLQIDGLYFPCWKTQKNFQPGQELSITYTANGSLFTDDTFGKPTMIEAGISAESADGNVGYGFDRIGYMPEGEDNAVALKFKESYFDEIVSHNQGIAIGRTNLIDLGDGNYMIRLFPMNGEDKLKVLLFREISIDGKTLTNSSSMTKLKEGTGMMEFFFLKNDLAQAGVDLQTASEMDFKLEYYIYNPSLNGVDFDEGSFTIDLQ